MSDEGLVDWLTEALRLEWWKVCNAARFLTVGSTKNADHLHVAILDYYAARQASEKATGKTAPIPETMP